MILYALSRDTGDIVWSAPLDTQPLLSIDSSPVLAGNTIVIGVASFEQCDPARGDQRHRSGQSRRHGG